MATDLGVRFRVWGLGFEDVVEVLRLRVEGIWRMVQGFNFSPLGSEANLVLCDLESGASEVHVRLVFGFGSGC